MAVTEISPPRPSRGRSVALVISLAVNVLLIAVLVVGTLRVIDGVATVRQGGVLGPVAVMRELPADRREAIRSVQLKHADAMRNARRRARRARLAAFRIFAAPQFDATAFAGALARVHGADTALEGEAIAVVKEVVATLTPAERAAIADKARRRARWWQPLLQN